MSTLQNTDLFAVHRGTETYKVNYGDILAGVTLPNALEYQGVANPTQPVPSPTGGLKAGMVYVLSPSGTIHASWTGVAGLAAVDGQLAVWEGAKWELIGSNGFSQPDATETVKGIAEIATKAEVTAGTDDQRIVTPLKLKQALDALPPGTSVGPTAPTAPQDKQLWYNSDDGRLYIYYTDADSSQWVDASPDSPPPAALWTRTGTVLSPANAGDVVNISAGTAALPGLTPVGDPRSGLFSPGADQLAVATGGTQRITVDASGRLLVGTSTAAGAELIQVQGLSGAPTAPGGIALRRSSIGATDDIGFLDFQNVSSKVHAKIRAVCDGTPGASAYPGALVFSTTAVGASAPTDRMRISSTGGVRLPDVYNQTHAVGANVFIDTDGTLKRTTSSIKYKTNIETLKDQYADAILNCRPVWYQSTSAGDNPNWGFWGFIAEEVAEIDPRLVQWKTVEQVVNEDGSRGTVPLDAPEPENVSYDRFVPHLLNLIKRQQQAIETLETKVAALEGGAI